MKKIYYTAIFGISAILLIKAQSQQPPPSVGGSNLPKDLCEAAEWHDESKSFPTGDVPIPATHLPEGAPRTDVSFDTDLEWQQKDYKRPDGTIFICSLKDPKITIHGDKLLSLIIPGDPLSPYTIYIHPEGFEESDKFLIDNSIVTPGDYNTAINLAVSGNPAATPPIQPTWEPGVGGTSVSASGDRNVNWIWLADTPQPSSVAIVGAEGKKIEIDHNSPLIIVRRITDKNGNLSNPGGPFIHSWQMKHLITAD